MKTSGSLQVVPDCVYFHELVAGDSDSIEVWVTNIGKKTERVRFSLPPKTPFNLSNAGTITIPPGLEANIVLKFKGGVSKLFQSELTCQSQSATISIPVIATPASSKIIAETQTLNLGPVGVNTQFKFVFSLTNLGMNEGEFDLSCEDESITMFPQKGSLTPGKSMEISCTLKNSNCGDFNTSISVNSKDSLEKPQQVFINATIVQNSISLEIDGKEINELDFRTIFTGQKRVIKTTIRNHGMYKRSFVVLPPQDTPITTPKSGNTSVALTEKQSDDSETPIFSATPTEGLLNSYETATINFIFTPPDDTQQIEDIENSFNQYASIEIVETGQKIDLQLSGKGVKHLVSFSSVDFDFGTVNVNQKVDKTLTIKNESNYLATHYHVRPLAQYRFVPMDGTIEPGNGKNVKISFFPKNLGIFDAKTFVSFNDKLFNKHINLIGTCGDPSDKPFKRVPIYETDEKAKYSINHPGKYGMGVEDLSRYNKLRSTYDGYIKESAARREVKTSMAAIRARAKKNAITMLSRTVGQYNDEDLKEAVENEMTHLNASIGNEYDFGIPKGEGLVPPDPKVIKKTTPLFVAHPEKFGLEVDTENGQYNNSSLHNRRKFHSDDNVTVKKKFKSKPTTPQEVAECSRPLTPAQQLQVVASHQTINFGQSSVFSTMIKSFTIVNNLQQSVLVSIHYEFEELTSSNPSSQVIGPHQTAGFDIKFCSKKPISFNKPIQYTVNGHHSYPVNISASVVPIDVQLSRNVVEFRFSPDSIHPVIKEFVNLVNKSNGQAQYSFTGMNTMFSLSDNSGVIDANKTVTLEISYKPTNHPHDEVTLIMNVVGGPSRALKCIGDVGIPKCVVSKKVINFGLIPIGIQKTQQIRIKNNGDDNAIFSISHDCMNELKVSPSNGRIAARDQLTFQLNYKSARAYAFDIPVTVNIAGANPITFNVIGQSELPKVQMSRTEFEFGRLFVGSSASMEATINNVGAIPAILFLDLTSHPEFRIEYSSELNDSGGNEKMNSIALVTNPIFVTKSQMSNLNSTLNNPNENENGSPNNTENDSNNENKKHEISSSNSTSSILAGDEVDSNGKSGMVYKIYIIENSSVTFDLIFRPHEVNDHSFELPITMMNIMTSSSFHLQPIVSAEAIKAPLSLSITAVDFGVAPIYNPSNPHSRSVVRQITLHNDFTGVLPWRFDASNKLCNDPAVFTIEPSSGSIEFAQNQTIHISFTPQAEIPYNIHLPIYVKTDKNDENIIGNVQLVGVGSKVLFRVSTNSITLPIVPIGVKSQATIYVLNDAFIETTLEVKMPVDNASFPLSITFPEGNLLQHTTIQLPIELTFSSNKPMSFSTMIALVNDAGQATTFSVTCTTDNSIFTLYPLLNSTPLKLKAGGGKPILAEVPKSITKPTELTARFNSVSDFIMLKGAHWSPSYNKRVLEFIKRYLNAIVLNTQLSDFPNDFIRNDGALLHELVSNLMGGKKIPMESDRGDSSINDPVLKRKELMNRLLKGLQSLGALVAHVKPEYLLTRADFLSIMRTKVMKQLLGIDRFNAPEMSTFDQKILGEFTSSKSFSDAILSRMKILEGVYTNLSNESWMILIMQIVKLFVINKIDPERLSQTPGVSDTIKQLQQASARFSTSNELMAEINRPTKSISNSNVYSISEGILLKWISIHHCKIMNDLQKTIINYADLSDSIAFSSLIKDHTSIFHGSPVDDPSDKHQKELNAIEVMNAMKNLKLGFCPRANEIVDGSMTMLCLITAYLFENLPRFLPVTTIEYTTTLHKTITRNVNVTNPSKTEITYKASLEGSSNFSMTSDSITIGLNGTADFPVQFNARTIKAEMARLTLMPCRPRLIMKTPDGTEPQSPKHQSTQIPTFYSPIVVDLVSSVTLTAPDASFSVEGMIYQTTKLTIPLKNYIGIPCNLGLTTKVIRLTDENGKQITQQQTVPQLIMNLIHNPINEDQIPSLNNGTSQDSLFKSYVKQHKAFIFSDNEIEFNSANSECTIELEFVPIRIGTFRCIVLFSSDQAGEFAIDIVAKSVLPQAIELVNGKIKIEANKKFSYNVPIDMQNANLIKALAYSIEKIACTSNACSERKFKDMLTRRTHECELLYKQSFSSQKFTIFNSSPQFFEIPDNVVIYKQAMIDSMAKNSGIKTNMLPVSFKPSKAGNYPCRIALVSPFDVRLFTINAIGLSATKELTLEFNTVSGRSMKQDVPFHNPSNEPWNFKITVTGDSSFSAPPRITVKPNSTIMLPVTYQPNKIGCFSGDLTVMNLNKESTVIYHMTAQVDEPPAEEKFVINCQARQKTTNSIKVKSSSIKNGKINVTTTIPIITYNSDYEFVNGELRPDFQYQIYAPRSGLAAGTITFTDPITKNFVWYILEIHVDSPAPEQTISVSTSARKCVTVNIPIANPKNQQAQFSVVLSDDDLFGDKVFFAPPNSTTNYQLVVSPLKEMKRMSSVYFYSEEDGEFWYSIKIDAEKAPDNSIAPLSSPIGKFASTFITLENPLEKIVSFRTENDNMTSFHIVSKRVIQLTSHEKKRIEVRYIPSSVGQKETASISFKSNEMGDWVYKLSGVGKPPQPLSPIIITSMIGSTNSAMVLFNNPFPYPSRFIVSLSTSEEEEVFKFLIKRKVFSLSCFGEEFQIPFTFTPSNSGQYKAHIIVASLGPTRNGASTNKQINKNSNEKENDVPTIRWVYPIIGDSLVNEIPNIRTIRTKAQLGIDEVMIFTLTGENEIFNPSEYAIDLSIPQNCEFVRGALDIRPVSVDRHENSLDLKVSIKFLPMRPLNTVAKMTVKNPLGQEWHFQLELKVDRGKPQGTIVVESLLNKVGYAKCSVPSIFRAQTPFHTYFVQGSASEFKVDSDRGFLFPSMNEYTEVPITIIFEPKMYGKVLKGLLVIDTIDAQFLFEVIGKTPEYVPPIVHGDSSRLGSHITPEEFRKSQAIIKKKRNVIKDNIENAKIAKPKVSTSTISFR
ncbi:hypothetical protein TRFO_35361 [Tritrichomonas foetus]|uniref:Calponin-homology (CH) domain-containing protein n=1 Tax=Tritrichomonas foetus TaxID=1144522 RepID=A0A1J4JGJ1_9EUKA|nr:hypothetical protein TRFO_35361 [Tritrichomonas foetus]|eukprot:OHS98266.1 hypothetical protein TRFO_35361 [Tritrichomonas foetus]